MFFPLSKSVRPHLLEKGRKKTIMHLNHNSVSVFIFGLYLHSVATLLGTPVQSIQQLCHLFYLLKFVNSKYTFITEVVVKGGVALGYIILRGVDRSNLCPPYLQMREAEY